jgi:predicted nucleic acid-binding Zn ribbon protein
VASVFSRWPEIAGPVLAEHVHPVRMAGDTLVVAADHPAWATRARAEGPAILRSVGQLAGTAPTRLDVVVRRR